MAYIYAFSPNEEDCSTIGLVGALMDEDAVFELNAGEFGQLTFTHPIDAYGKWRALRIGVILKTMVPMRLCPEVRGNGTYVEAVDEYAVAATATRNQRYVYGKKAGGKRKKLLAVGTKVIVTGVADASDAGSRYKVKCGKASGWMERAGLELTRRSVAVAQGPDGLERVEPSYAVRQQLFRITAAEPNAGEDGAGIRVTAMRIAYDLLGNISLYSENGSVSCAEACEGVLSETIVPHDFSAYTDIGDVHTGFDAADRNPVAALIDPEAGVAARWGGEVVADDYDIYVLRRAGLDRGVRIAYGRNLVGLNVSMDASGTANAIRPKGENRDGTALYLDGHVVGGRHGYNYDGASGTCADWLPDGYRFYTAGDGSVRGSVIVRADLGDDDLPRIAVIECEDCRVEKGGANVTAAIARRRMAAQAIGEFEAGCDLPDVTMDVDFVMLGDTAEYAQYRHLEALFVYDTVRVRDSRIGVAADVALTSVKWLVRAERVAAATFGALNTFTASIQGWQLAGGISGSKLSDGTVGGAALSDGCIDVRHVQADSINTDALQANSVTAEKLEADSVNAMTVEAVRAHIGSVTAESIATDALTAAFANLLRVAAGDIEAGRVETDRLAAAIVDVVTVQARTGEFDFAAASNLVSSALSLQRGQADSMYITNLAITSANLLNATIGRLILRGDDGNYYEAGVGSDGVIRTAPVEVTEDERAGGQTADGRQIVEDAVNADSIAGRTVQAAEAVLGTVLTRALNAGQITASDALLASASIPALYVTSVAALGERIDISANAAITMLAGSVARMLRLDEAGLHVGGASLPGEVLIDGEAVSVVLNGARYSRFGPDYVRFSDYQLRRSADGGLVFQMGSRE